MTSDTAVQSKLKFNGYFNPICLFVFFIIKYKYNFAQKMKQCLKHTHVEVTNLWSLYHN